MSVNDSLKLAALATIAIPGLDVVATRAPQRSTSDYRYGGVLDSDGRHWVVQAPLHAAAGIALDAEREFLSRVAALGRKDGLPFDVVQIKGTAPTEDGWNAVIYENLAGTELDYDALVPGPGLTRSLARAIAAIHELPPAVVDDAGLPVYDATSFRARKLAEVDDAARTGKVPTILLSRWEQALEDVALWKFTPAVVHGDLAPENVITGGKTVVAVLNWANAHVGDPAEDLAWLYAGAPESCLDTIEEAYAIGRHEPPDGHLVDRALLYSELAVARWLLHGTRIGSQKIVRDAQQMLADLARQVEAAAPAPEPEAVPDADVEPSASDAPEPDESHEADRTEEWDVSGSLSVTDSEVPSSDDAVTPQDEAPRH